MDPNQTVPKLLRRGLLLIAAFVVFQAASGCGKVASTGDTGSETHWLMRCESDAECGAGSCACGVCTLTCTLDADCSELNVPGVRCFLPMTCTAEPEFKATDGGCFVPCQSNADCAALASAASCERGRCELPPGAVLGTGVVLEGAGGTGNSGTGGTRGSDIGAGGTASGGNGTGGTGGTGEIATLCDGSDDVRLISIRGGGFVDEYYAFAQTYGAEFYAIDGRCRFWQGYNGGRVFAGTLDPGRAQSFARSIRFGTFSQIRYTDEYDCFDGGSRTIRSFEGALTCSCDCVGGPDAPPGFDAAFAADEQARAALFQDGELVTGAVQLLLLETGEPFPVEYTPLPWPLERAPAAPEILSLANGYVNFGESSGVLITDPGESATLRSTREAFEGGIQYSGRYIPVVFPAAGQSPRYFQMLLRDEVPPAVKAALQGTL